jgi:hypothetical protein
MAFREAADEIVSLVAGVMRECHPELVAEGVTVDVLEAYTPPKEVKPTRGKRRGPPRDPKPPRPSLWKDGLPCLALAKINSHEVRVEGGKDCSIKIDIEEWKKLPDGRRRALIDHELRHFMVVCDDDGNTKFDAQGRPKMRLRPHDHQVGVFLDVIDRHGWQATEALSLRDAVRRVKQLSFGWDEAAEPAVAGAA